MAYLKNVWYLAAWSNELPAKKLLARTMLGEPIVLYRKSDGSPVALFDRCPHRFAPLSAGLVDGDNIMCRYHGLVFDASGACALNPHGPVPRNARLRAYPVHEAHRGIWIWTGDATLANPELIPNLSYLATSPENSFSCGVLVARGNYELVVDNLMDLSHVDYLHPTTLGGGATTSSKPKVEVKDPYIDVIWEAPGSPPPPLILKLLGENWSATDLFTRMRWFPPSVIELLAKFTPSGLTDAESVINHNAHILTPESETTTHYFYAATRNFRPDDANLNADIAATREHIFANEDKPMIELVQQRMLGMEFWSMKPMLLSIDAGPVRVRRKLKELIEMEQSKMEPALVSDGAN